MGPLSKTGSLYLVNMTNSQWLRIATAKLQRAGIGTARLDSLVLLEDITGLDRAKLLAEPDLELSASQQAKLKKLLNRRATHEPLAYVRGQTEFYGRKFILSPAVLEPRPESETMIDCLKALPVFQASAAGPGPKTGKPGRPVRLADVGTGSGALGITAKLELPDIEVQLLDIDSEALKIAKINVDKFTLKISSLKTDLLSGSSCDYDILLANLPYVPDDYQINQAAAREPRLAIFGGPDGLDLYRKLFHQLKNLAVEPLYILTEALPPQHAALRRLAGQAGYRLRRADDFIQVFEIAAGRPEAVQKPA